MDLFSQDISSLVFRPRITPDMGKVSLSAVMLDVLRELDGTKDSVTVSRSLQISMNSLRDTLRRLHALRLIEQVEAKSAVVDRGFFETLEARLADIMGPMAAVLIRDEITKMGEESRAFPVNRCDELVGRLASKIFVERKRSDFLQAMTKVRP